MFSTGFARIFPETTITCFPREWKFHQWQWRWTPHPDEIHWTWPAQKVQKLPAVVKSFQLLQIFYIEMWYKSAFFVTPPKKNPHVVFCICTLARGICPIKTTGAPKIPSCQQINQKLNNYQTFTTQTKVPKVRGAFSMNVFLMSHLLSLGYFVAHIVFLSSGSVYE